MKKYILKLDVQDEKEKRKALKTVSAFPGIDEISIDTKGRKLTIIGTVDPVALVTKLRKYWPADIISAGPAKEPEKKEEPKKEEGKKEQPKKEEAKEEPKKEEPKKEEGKKEEPKKEEEKKAEPVPIPPAGAVVPYRPQYPPMQTIPYRPYYPPMQTYYYPPQTHYYPPQTHYYAHQSIEENPNACVIF